jgi:hypothetical protein
MPSLVHYDYVGVNEGKDGVRQVAEDIWRYTIWAGRFAAHIPWEVSDLLEGRRVGV